MPDPLLGCSLEGARWFNCFAVTGEFFYHSNFRAPRFLKYLMQMPELHPVHHQLDVHKYNFADLPIRDRLFGTCRDADESAPQCGFPRHNKRKLGRMLVFRDVYHG
jgi:sterol desaturase/sphingolipid hydroxylase (fatty acid hydroxylase superfamily)